MSDITMPLAVDANGLAALMNISLSHVRRLDAAGKLPRPVRVGRSVRWPVDEIRRWLAAGAPGRSEWEKMKH